MHFGNKDLRISFKMKPLRQVDVLGFCQSARCYPYNAIQMPSLPTMAATWCGMQTFCPSGPQEFEDIPAGHWYQAAIQTNYSAKKWELW
jgi:hypothetical protein